MTVLDCLSKAAPWADSGGGTSSGVMMTVTSGPSKFDEKQSDNSERSSKLSPECSTSLAATKDLFQRLKGATRVSVVDAKSKAVLGSASSGGGDRKGEAAEAAP